MNEGDASRNGRTDPGGPAVSGAATGNRRGMSIVRSYLELTKPSLVSLLVFTAVVGMVVAAATDRVPLTVHLFLLGLLGIIAGSAGCNAVTCYIDRDIDGVMQRTRSRPLPAGRISPPEHALEFGLVLIGLSLIVAALGNLLALVFMGIGVLDNVVVYSLWLKRTSPWSIVLGGISGGMPVAYGWAFVAGRVDAGLLLLAAVVVLWTPTHIWSLALRYKEDYARARIPMLPVVVNEATAARCMAVASVLLVPFSLLVPLATGVAGVGYEIVAASFGAAVVALNLWLWLRPTRRRAWVVFKFSSPYLAVLFLALMIGSVGSIP